MERLVAETETEVKTEKEIQQETEVKTEEISAPILTEEQQIEKAEPQEEYQTEYIKSFQNATLGDMMRMEDKKNEKVLQQEKEELIKEQYEEKTENENIIEKPNYDLIETNKKVIKLHKIEEQTERPKERKKRNKKFGIALAVGLAISGVLCVTNIALLDHYSASLSSVETEFYEVNLPKYLKNIANLDTTKKSMEFLDTYPEEINPAGDLGKKTNWFDKFCNFISGLFGG